MFARPTTMAEAFINVTAKMIKNNKVDHQRGTGHWVARKVIENATHNVRLGIVTERDSRPTRS